MLGVRVGGRLKGWGGSAPALPQVIKQSVLELKLQAEESFVLKVVQLEELLQVRHSVFVIGNAGCGKSQVAAKHSQGGLGAGIKAAGPYRSCHQHCSSPIP